MKYYKIPGQKIRSVSYNNFKIRTLKLNEKIRHESYYCVKMVEIVTAISSFLTVFHITVIFKR